MNAVVIGATSASGKVLVRKLLEQGHTVTAVVRAPEKMPSEIENLRVVKGDVREKESFREAIGKGDIVFSFLGPKGDVKKIAAQGTQNIIDVMKEKQAQNLIAISVAGIPVKEDQRGKSLIDGLLRLFLKDMYADREAQLDVLRKSGLRWTALRVPRLTDQPASGSTHAFFGRPSPSMKVSREDLADFMIAEAEIGEWVGRAPIIAGG
jgi:putative NADH-flavin reductase